jgi:dihydrofolate reductase
MKISLVVAAARNGIIGFKGKMPWHLPADLKHFKNVTWGLPIIMGRKTFESLGRPLPGRQNIVITRHSSLEAPGVIVVNDPEQALAEARKFGVNEVCVIGGGEIYKLFFARANRIYFTRIEADFEGDTSFPQIDASAWTLITQLHHPADDKNVIDLVFQQWDRHIKGS